MSKLMVIDDDEAVRENLVELFELEGFEVISAENGRAGVRLARQHLPDLIVCDIMMPELDGYGVLEELRQDSATATDSSSAVESIQSALWHTSEQCTSA